MIKKTTFSKQFVIVYILFISFFIPILTIQAQEVCAVPAANVLSDFQQPNGDLIQLKLVGDAFASYFETSDGYTVIKDVQDGYYKYAKEAQDGSLVSNGNIVTNSQMVSGKSSTGAKDAKPHIRYSGKALEERKKEREQFFLANQQSETSPSVLKSPTGVEAVNVAAIGRFKNLLILIDFPDRHFAKGENEFIDLMNKNGYSVNNQVGSFRDYYLDNSYGKLDVQTTVVGWYRAQHNMAYYANDPDDGGIGKARYLVREAVDAAEAEGIDFSQFDNNNDGECDLVTITHAGPGAEYIGLDTEYIWSHKSHLNDKRVQYDGVSINKYNINPELAYNGSQNIISDIGVYVHEFGHALGLPDLYVGNNANNGAGFWDVMSWLVDTGSPVEFNPYFKEKLGWGTATVLQNSGSVVNMDNTGNGATFYKIETPDPKEFYMLSNMQRSKWHRSIPNTGLMIWHIDERNLYSNADTAHMHAVPEQADGLQHLQYRHDGTQGNIGDAGDPYPGTSGNTTFNTTSTPSSTTNSGQVVDMALTNIQEVNGLISFDFSDGVAVSKENQTINFTAIPNKIYNDADFMLSASSSSDLPVTFSVKSGPIEIVNGKIHITGTGEARVAANQSGNANYNAAAEVVRSFTITKAYQIITINEIEDKHVNDPSFDLVASVDSNLDLTFSVAGPASISGRTISLNGTSGVVRVTASQAGNANYKEAAAQINFNVSDSSKENQTINFTAISDKIYSDADFDVSAISSSGLPVTFSVISGPVEILNGKIHIIGVGHVVLAANQGGNAEYNAAVEVRQEFDILKAPQLIQIEDIADMHISDDSFDIEASVDSGLTLSYEVAGVASIENQTISLTGEAGLVTLTVEQAGNEHYLPAEKEVSFNVFEELSNINVRVYPNPSSGVLHINSNQMKQAKIYSLGGSVLEQFDLATEDINLSALNGGVYILELVTNSNKVIFIKVVKKNE